MRQSLIAHKQLQKTMQTIKQNMHKQKQQKATQKPSHLHVLRFYVPFASFCVVFCIFVCICLCIFPWAKSKTITNTTQKHRPKNANTSHTQRTNIANKRQKKGGKFWLWMCSFCVFCLLVVCFLLNMFCVVFAFCAASFCKCCAFDIFLTSCVFACLMRLFCISWSIFLSVVLHLLCVCLMMF